MGVAQAKKTHCPKGHRYTAKNTRVYRGRRYCRACGAPKGQVANKAKARCKQGHRLVGANVYEYRGRRCCRECQTARRLKWEATQDRPGHFRGEDHPNAKLREEDVHEIRAERVLSQSELARLYPVTRTQIRRVQRRDEWTHV